MRANDDSSLIPGEQLLQRMRPHWIVLVRPTAVLLLATTTYVWLLTMLATWGNNGATTATHWILAACYLFVLLRWSINGIIRWATTTYLFTDQRIITRSGLLRIDGESIALNKIHSIQFSKTLLERVFGSGSLTIETAAENQVHIRNVTHAEEVQKALYEQIVQQQEPTEPHRPLA